MPRKLILKEPTSNHPHLTRNNSFGVLVIIFLLLKIAFLLFSPNNHYTLASDLTPANILNAVNRERSLRNLTILTTNDKLGMAAQSKSDDMVARKYFAHVDPDGHYIWDKIVADGYTPYTELGENLAIEFYDTDSLMAAWMNSPTHRANVLKEGFRDQGMGLTFGDVQQGQYYSAIANTFGAQSINTKIAQTPPPAKPVTQAPSAPATPAPTPAPKTKPSQPAQTLTTKPSTAITSYSSPITSSAPKQNINTRGAEPTPQSPVPNNVTPAEPILSKPIGHSASAVIGNDQTVTLTDNQVNRYLILICGVALLLLMISDIKIVIEKKLGALDKKINNLVVLIISLVVIAFMYWF